MNFVELLCFFGILLIVVGGPVWLLTGKLEQGFAVAGFTGLVAAGMIGMAPAVRSLWRWLRGGPAPPPGDNHQQDAAQ